MGMQVQRMRILLLLAADATIAHSWSNFTIDQIFAAPSVLHPGLGALIPWTQQDAGSRQILREDTAASDATSALQQRLEEAIKREDYQMASTLKEQLTADSTVINARIWADSPTAGALATEPVTGAGLKRTAAGVWRGIVEGVQSTFSSDLDAAQSLVLAMINRAAQMGSYNVKISPRQTLTGFEGCSENLCMRSYKQEWHHNQPWMYLPPCGTEAWATQLTDGATCFAASKEVDGPKRAKFHSLCASKTAGVTDKEDFSSCWNGNHRISQRLFHFCTGPACHMLDARSDAQKILSIGDFCKFAASTFAEAVVPEIVSCRNRDSPLKPPVHPFGKWACHSPTVTKFVTVEVVDSTHGDSWVYGRTAGMLYTLHLLEREWNQTLHKVQRFEFSSQDDINQGTSSSDKYGSHREFRRHDPSAERLIEQYRARTHARTIPNFLGPIGPNQPPAKPWDVSRYDILLNVADRQRMQGLLTEQQHTQVSEQLVLAGRFHREHSAFENTLQPAWVDSLHTVLEHPVARKILVWKLQSEGINVSIAPEFASVQYSHKFEKMEVASALVFDLHHPLSTASQRAVLVGEDDLADFVTLI